VSRRIRTIVSTQKAQPVLKISIWRMDQCLKTPAAYTHKIPEPRT
jgi:hypothetical protein